MATNGQLLIGGSSGPAAATLAEGDNVSITNGDGTISIASSHPTIDGAATSSDNSGRTYIQDITLDSNGHVTGLATASETVTDTTYSAGDGLELNGTAFSVDLKANGGVITEGADNELALDLGASSITGTLANNKTTATSANTADKIVARDSNGDFIAGTIDSSIKLNLSGNGAGDHQGIIMYSGSTSLTGQAGKLVALSGGSWVLADKDSVGTSGSCLIGVALGSGSGSPATDGTLLYGMVTLSTDPGSAGDPLYVGISGAAENDVSGYTSGDTGSSYRVLLEQPENSVSAINRLD